MSDETEDPKATAPAEIDYRWTLNLPRTDFPMRANLAELEPRMLAFWEENKIREKMLESASASLPESD